LTVPAMRSWATPTSVVRHPGRFGSVASEIDAEEHGDAIR